jgi:hypothetical protein
LRCAVWVLSARHIWLRAYFLGLISVDVYFCRYENLNSQWIFSLQIYAQKESTIGQEYPKQ